MVIISASVLMLIVRINGVTSTLVSISIIRSASGNRTIKLNYPFEDLALRSISDAMAKIIEVVDVELITIWVSSVSIMRIWSVVDLIRIISSLDVVVGVTRARKRASIQVIRDLMRGDQG